MQQAKRRQNVVKEDSEMEKDDSRPLKREKLKGGYVAKLNRTNVLKII